MAARASEKLPIQSGEDVVRVRQAVRQWAVDMGFSLVEQTKIVTAASELARNTLEHGGGGSIVIEEAESINRMGLRLTFLDSGPGIEDVGRALTDGFTTGGGLGLGLGGAKRLMSDLDIKSKVGEGTRIQTTRWK